MSDNARHSRGRSDNKVFIAATCSRIEGANRSNPAEVQVKYELSILPPPDHKVASIETKIRYDDGHETVHYYSDNPRNHTNEVRYADYPVREPFTPVTEFSPLVLDIIDIQPGVNDVSSYETFGVPLHYSQQQQSLESGMPQALRPKVSSPIPSAPLNGDNASPMLGSTSRATASTFRVREAEFGDPCPMPFFKPNKNGDILGSFKIYTSDNDRNSALTVTVGIDSSHVDIVMSKTMRQCLQSYVVFDETEGRVPMVDSVQQLLGHQLVKQSKESLEKWMEEKHYINSDKHKLRICQRRLGGVLFFYIKWKGHPSSANTWEPVSHVGFSLKKKDMGVYGKYRRALNKFFTSRPAEADGSLGLLPEIYYEILEWIELDRVMLDTKFKHRGRPSAT